MSAAADIAPYERLARMIEHELELIGNSRVAEFQAAVLHRGEYLASLPSPAPVAARGAVARAQALHTRVEIEALRVRESLQVSRATLRRTRQVRKTYTGPIRRRISTSA